MTGVLGGLGASNLGAAAAGGMAPYIANKIKHATSTFVDGQEQTNVLANTMAHAVAGAVLAQLAGNSATAGAAGAAGGELMARAILRSMYPGKQTSDLTQDQKQIVSALGQLAAQLSAGVASGSVEGGIQGAVAGKNAVENNTLGSDDEDDEFQLEHGNRPVKIISFTPKRIGVVDDDGDVKGMGGIIAGGAKGAGTSLERGLAYDNPSNLIQSRVSEIQSQIPANSQGRITMGVAVVEDANGVRSVLVSTSEPRGYLRPGVSLQEGEKVVVGTGHAEADIVSYANANGLKVVDIGATRPVCASCQNVIEPTGANVSTPLKPLPKAKK